MSANNVGRSNSAYSSHPVTCEQCGTVVPVIASRRRKNRWHFCSHPCYSLWRKGRFAGPDNSTWRGGYDPYYGPNWRQQKRKARERDHHACQECGVTSAQTGCALDVHHIQPFRTFGYIPEQNDAYLLANDLANLTTLCRSCHGKARRPPITQAS